MHDQQAFPYPAQLWESAGRPPALHASSLAQGAFVCGLIVQDTTARQLGHDFCRRARRMPRELHADLIVQSPTDSGGMDDALAVKPEFEGWRYLCGGIQLTLAPKRLRSHTSTRIPYCCQVVTSRPGLLTSTRASFRHSPAGCTSISMTHPLPNRSKTFHGLHGRACPG